MLKICYIYVLLAECDGCAERISARVLDVTGRAQQGLHTEKRPRANISQVRSRARMVNTIFITLPKMLRKPATNTYQKIANKREIVIGSQVGESVACDVK